MQVNILEAKNQLSKLVAAASRGEEVVIAKRGKPVVRLVKAEAPRQRRWGAWQGLISEAEIAAAFSPEAEAEMAALWQGSVAAPTEPEAKPRRRPAAPNAKKVRKPRP
ncbi:MAG: type II toxin-antitoxin system prevent-host-death family antitoxin [Proteobacteria bacterium]|nr:type II toxin-antitoxin system prevent-host-death family antitoxin [Pseudomonadota bacterium]